MCCWVASAVTAYAGLCDEQVGEGSRCGVVCVWAGCHGLYDVVDD